MCSIAFLLLTFNLTLTDSDAQTGTFQVSVVGTAVGSVPRQIDLKVTQLPGRQLSQVSGFVVGPEDVLQVKQGENLIVSTSPGLTPKTIATTSEIDDKNIVLKFCKDEIGERNLVRK